MYKKKYSYKVCPCKVCLSGLALNKKLLKQKKMWQNERSGTLVAYNNKCNVFYT